MKKQKLEPCNKHSDCFAHISGFCLILELTDFGNRDCPFYKTVENLNEGRSKSYWRLIELGRNDLIIKFKVRAFNADK